MVAHMLGRRGGWAWSASLLCCLCGCRVTWDDITSKEFTVSAIWKAPPEPLVVLKDSTDGYARAKALIRLEEPTGDPNLKEKHLQILQTTAQGDRDPLCRLAAIRTLGRYKDPRAAKTLADVYLGNPGMSPENNALIRQQSLAALEQNGPVEARQLFIRAAKQPAGGLTTTAQRDRLEILDERLTAIRALGKYPQSDSVETLVSLLETEKDIAVRACAHESLKSATKKDIPADPKAWRDFVATGKEPSRSTFLASTIKREPSNGPQPEEPGIMQKIGTWVRPDPVPGQTVSTPSTRPNITPASAPSRQERPTTLPPTLPPSSPTINQVGLSTPRPTTPAPATISTPGIPVRNPTTTPDGAYRNSQGEVVVPVTP